MNSPVAFSTASTPVRFTFDDPIPRNIPGATYTRELQINNNWNGRSRNVIGLTSEVFIHDDAEFYNETQGGFKWFQRMKIVTPRIGITPSQTFYSPWTTPIQFKVEHGANPGLGGPGGSGIIGANPGGGQGGTLGGTGTPGNVKPAETVTTNATLAGFSLPVIGLALAAFFLLRKKL
jgi:hypothetical protein